MTDFEKWKERYEKKWCTKDNLKKLVELKVLTKEEYKSIVGGDIE